MTDSWWSAHVWELYLFIAVCVAFALCKAGWMVVTAIRSALEERRQRRAMQRWYEMDLAADEGEDGTITYIGFPERDVSIRSDEILQMPDTTVEDD